MRVNNHLGPIEAVVVIHCISLPVVKTVIDIVQLSRPWMGASPCRKDESIRRRAGTHGEMHALILPFIAIQVVAQPDDPLTGEHAENRPLVFREV